MFSVVLIFSRVWLLKNGSLSFLNAEICLGEDLSGNVVTWMTIPKQFYALLQIMRAIVFQITKGLRWARPKQIIVYWIQFVLIYCSLVQALCSRRVTGSELFTYFRVYFSSVLTCFFEKVWHLKLQLHQTRLIINFLLINSQFTVGT